ncbi:winged helix-turn-helix transcriptional regulator [Mycolicibacterium phlei]
MRRDPWTDAACPIARTMSVLGQRWAILIVREALLGRTKFSEFRERLGIASDVLSARLSELVDAGILEVADYQQPGERTRRRYVLTDAGRDLAPVLAAIGQWGHAHLARTDSSNYRFVDTTTGEPVAVGFRSKAGKPVKPGTVALVAPGES